MSPQPKISFFFFFFPGVVQAVETRGVTFQRRSGSAPDVGLFNTPPLCARGKDAAGTEGDGKHRANLQDLNWGFRFLPQGSGAAHEPAIQPKRSAVQPETPEPGRVFNLIDFIGQ